MNYNLILIPIISAIIGWFTNKIAIYMLFYPEQPIHILGYTLQGIFPKRQHVLAKKIGKMVAEQLLSIEDLKQKMVNPTALDQINHTIEEKIDVYLTETAEDFKPFSYLIPKKWIQNLKTSLTTKVETSIPEMINGYFNDIEKELDIEKIVEEKVNALHSSELSDLLNSILKSEFFFIEILGAILGFIIGLIQVALVYFF